MKILVFAIVSLFASVAFSQDYAINSGLYRFTLNDGKTFKAVATSVHEGLAPEEADTATFIVPKVQSMTYTELARELKKSKRRIETKIIKLDDLKESDRKKLEQMVEGSKVAAKIAKEDEMIRRTTPSFQATQSRTRSR